MTYAEKLSDPLWQKKRLELFERADWRCEECGARRRTLHVHHGYYQRGLSPWEYPDETLHPLCYDCHEKAQALLERIHRTIGAERTEGVAFCTGVLHGALLLDRTPPPLPDIDLPATPHDEDCLSGLRAGLGLHLTDAEFAAFYDPKTRRVRAAEAIAASNRVVFRMARDLLTKFPEQYAETGVA